MVSVEQKIIGYLSEGNKKALNLLYEHYSASLYGVILKVTNNDYKASTSNNVGKKKAEALSNATFLLTF